MRQPVSDSDESGNLVRLRPEQVIGSLFQAGHIRTIDQNSNPFVRVTKFGNVNDFLDEYRHIGDDEMLQQVGTIPQALLRMNGRFKAEQSKVDERRDESVGNLGSSSRHKIGR